MSKEALFSKLGILLRDSEILMRELEEEREEAFENLKFEIEEEAITHYYKKVLTSVYRMRNNAAALLLRNSCDFTEDEDNIDILAAGILCKISKQALRGILHEEYDSLLKKNITDLAHGLGSSNLDSTEVSCVPKTVSVQEQLPSEQLLSEQLLSEQLLSEQLLSEQLPSEQLPSELPPSEQPPPVLSKPNRELFKPNVISFDTKKTDTDGSRKELLKPRFTTEASSGNPDEIISQLKNYREKYDHSQLQLKVEEAERTECSGTVFDLSTGAAKMGQLDTKEAVDKIEKVAESLIQTSRKDKIVNTSLREYSYNIQNESDYERNLSEFILDLYSLTLIISDNEDNVLRKEAAEVIVAPVTIPQNGNTFVTDICVYLESGGESNGAVVSPGGKTTIAMRCEDYSVFIRGSWENGGFVSTLSAVGNGSKVKCEIKKRELRPTEMNRAGIGHNVLLLDHATTVHIIPISFDNVIYHCARFMCVVIKDYGIDQDAQCLLSDDKTDILVKGEKLKYNIRCAWDDNKNLAVFQGIAR